MGRYVLGVVPHAAEEEDRKTHFPLSDFQYDALAAIDSDTPRTNEAMNEALLLLALR